MATREKRISKRGRVNEGKPPKYRKDFHPEDFLRLSKEGKTDIEIAALWGVHRNRIYNWAKSHPEFSEAFKLGRDASEAWYINFGKNIAAGKVKNANVTAYIWLTKNCIGWSDKIEQTNINTDLEWDEEDEN